MNYKFKTREEAVKHAESWGFLVGMHNENMIHFVNRHGEHSIYVAKKTATGWNITKQ